MTADKETRGILIRDSNRMIQVAVISNPKITDGEVAAIAYSRQVDDEVLRRIAAEKEWTQTLSRSSGSCDKSQNSDRHLPENWSQPSTAKI